MLTVLMLEDDDKIQSDDWCRPLTLSDGGGDVESISQYGGTPQNNIRWIRVRDALGECWWGKTVKEVNGMFSKSVHVDNQRYRWEFIRGSVPASHVWNWRALHAAINKL